MKTFFVLIILGAFTPLSPENIYEQSIQTEGHPIAPVIVVYDSDEQCGEGMKKWEGRAAKEKVDIHYNKCIPIVLPEAEQKGS